MALFNRDYDRDYRYGGAGYRGGMARNDNRDFGDRMRAGWNNMTNNTFGNDYDRNYTTGTGTWNRGYGASNMGYDRDYRYRGTPGGRVGGGLTNNNDYDRDFDRARTVGRGYDVEYKSRWQTDQGDPFNDRQRHTPFRVTRGEYEGSYDRDYNRGGFANRGYDRDLNQGSYSTGVGYDPYTGPNQYGNRGNAWTQRQGRGYDRGFF